MRKFCIGLIFLNVLLFYSPVVKAESEASCAIWLCLPGGFPTGCSDAHSEFKHRIKKGKSPLPALSSCTTGPDGHSTNGKYEIGLEYYMPCKEGFVIDKKMLRSSNRGICNSTNPLCTGYSTSKRARLLNCESYNATRRVNPRYVKMWIDGQSLGQFFYQ